MATIEQPRTLQEWLTERRSMIGASESPAIFGCGYSNQSPFTVWAEKTGQMPIDAEEEREELEWGRDMQPLILSRFERKTGIKVRDLGEFTIQRHPDYPWMGCTLDGLAEVDGQLAVVEAKNVGQYNASEWSDHEPPLRVMVQIQHQMAVVGAQCGYAVACVGGRKLQWRRIKRSQRFIDAMIPKLAEFWALVESNTPPEIDGSEATRRAIGALYPDDSGAMVLLPAESDAWTEECEELSLRIKGLETDREKLRNNLRVAMGHNSMGQTPGGEIWTYKTQTRAEHIVRESTFRVLRKVKGKKK